jgi:hypothetical protein
VFKVARLFSEIAGGRRAQTTNNANRLFNTKGDRGA